MTLHLARPASTHLTMLQALLGLGLAIFTLALTTQAHASPALFNARAFEEAAHQYISSSSDSTLQKRSMLKNDVVALAQDRYEHLREAVSGNDVDTDAVLEIVNALTAEEVAALPAEARLLMEEEIVDTEGTIVTMHCMPLPPHELADELGEIETAAREFFCSNLSFTFVQ